MINDILVIAEHRNGQLLPITYEMLSLARDLADTDDGPTILAVLDKTPLEMAGLAAQSTGADVPAVMADQLGTYNREAVLEVLTGILVDLPVKYILAAHTTTGMDFAPALAIRLKAALVSGIEGIHWEDGAPRFAKAMFGGKVEAHFAPQTHTTILTVMPGAFKATNTAVRTGEVKFVESNVLPKRIRVLGISEGQSDETALQEADVIVAVGRGLGKPENIELAKKLADLFPRAALAGSRPVCDQGWLEYKHQVGQTGTTVSPRLYIALGISGARQHTMGMQGAGFIVAVSTDPNAAIFNIADVCIIEDLTEFISVLLERAGVRFNG